MNVLGYCSITSTIGVDYAILAQQIIDYFPCCLFWELSFIYQQIEVGSWGVEVGGLGEFRTSAHE